MDDKKEFNNTIALINGNQVAYDLCANRKNVATKHPKVYLGEGIIYSVDGVRHNGNERLHFWKWVK